MTGALSRVGLAAAGAALALSGTPCGAEQAAPQRTEFAWRAPIELPAGAGVARVDLPGPALVQLQSSDASDLRIYNAAGEPVAFARMNPRAAAAPVARTPSYAALPLYSAASRAARPQGAVQVRIDDGQQRSVWVQMDGAQAAGAPRLSSVLFAMQDEKQPLGAIEVQATLPANTPIRITAFSSADLAQWTPAPVRGRLYRFDGDGAPVNMTLEFEQPVNLEGRYLRLDWTGQEGVSITAVTGVVAAPAQAPRRVRVELPALKPAGAGAMELATGFLTPIAGLAIATSRDNSLLPLRILGRNEPSQPWRQLGQTVVYRLGSSGADGINPPAALHGASARWLRLESTNAAELSGAGLAASVEFEPVQLVFLATGAGPFELAAGRAATPAAALPLTMISSALGHRKLEDLPVAALGSPIVQAQAQPGWLAAAWPGLAPNKTFVLWGVLLAGVLLLAAVAWSLLRQLKTRPPTQP